MIFCCLIFFVYFNIQKGFFGQKNNHEKVIIRKYFDMNG